MTKTRQSAGGFDPPPKLSELGLDLLVISRAQRWFAVALPFLLVGIYFFAAFSRNWFVAIAALFYLSFFTYGSTSHDLVHRNLGLSRTVNEVFLTLVELLALRSGHAYRKSHLHHHASYPADDDLEAAASKKSFMGALLDGVTFHFRLWWWALKRSKKFERVWIISEGIIALGLVVASVACVRTTVIPIVYVLLMVMGAWITPLVTSYVPHDANGKTELEQTRVFRGTVLSVLALEHLYHLEHHLYPAVPHQNWAKLARRLDPYLEEQGILARKLWF